jgi:hypothetical protein
MKIAHLFAAVAATALIGGAAYAQDQSAQPAQPAPAVIPNTTTPNTTAADATALAKAAAPTGQTVATAATTVTDRSGASMTVSTTTNGPVADTPANRAKYGQPLSHAGKRTLAKGN